MPDLTSPSSPSGPHPEAGAKKKKAQKTRTEGELAVKKAGETKSLCDKFINDGLEWMDCSKVSKFSADMRSQLNNKMKNVQAQAI